MCNKQRCCEIGFRIRNHYEIKFRSNDKHVSYKVSGVLLMLRAFCTRTSKEVSPCGVDCLRVPNTVIHTPHDVCKQIRQVFIKSRTFVRDWHKTYIYSFDASLVTIGFTLSLRGFGDRYLRNTYLLCKLCLESRCFWCLTINVEINEIFEVQVLPRVLYSSFLFSYRYYFYTRIL